MHAGANGRSQIAKTVNNLLLWALCAEFAVRVLATPLGADVPKRVDALNQASGAKWSLSHRRSAKGKWAEKDMDVALDIAQYAKVPMPASWLVDQLVKSISQDNMKELLS